MTMSSHRTPWNRWCHPRAQNVDLRESKGKNVMPDFDHFRVQAKGFRVHVHLQEGIPKISFEGSLRNLFFGACLMFILRVNCSNA